MLKRNAVEPETISVAEMRAMLGISIGAAYAAIARSEIPHFRIGTRILIPRAWLQERLHGTQK